jgi:hypothetical protein
MDVLNLKFSSQLTGTGFLFFLSFFPVTKFLPKLRQLLLESQSQLDAAKSEAQKQSDELALVGGCCVLGRSVMRGLCV